ncbi:MAG: VWA domain-containing protein [Candidatus Caccosoma sp.]|nr:VWA domain-containing protein [Candidatus Caccosoma sp.]
MISFLHPLGLIGLIGIPIVIIIYLLKNKYTEKVISSTYIWNLSEKFLRKKNPIHKINGLLSLILQIISILFLTLCIARPIISIRDKAKNYMFIIDSSFSMNMKNDENETRMQRAKNEINKMVKESKNGSYYSLIYASDTSSLLVNKTNNKETIYNSLLNITTSNKSIMLDNAMELMQQYYYEDSSYDVYVLTDKDYIETSNVNVINISNNEINSTISSLSIAYGTTNNISVNGTLITYGSDLKVNISLFIDDEIINTIDVETFNGIETNFTFETKITSYSKIEAKIVNDDALIEDNNYILYSNESSSDFKTLIVSEQPTFLNNVLKILGNKSISVIKPNEYNETKTGFSLYVFDAYAPNNLPDDGTVWLFKANKNISSGGFTVQNEINLASGGELTLSKDTSATYKSLSKNLNGKGIYVSKYQKYSLYNDATILFEYNNDPMIFALLNNYNNREIVFSFDLHDSNFALSLDFVPLFKNLINYSIPNFLENSNYVVGEILKLNVLPFTNSIRINSPSNISKYLNVSSSNTVSYELNEIGTYEIVLNINNNTKKYNIFVSCNLNESKTNEVVDSILLVGENNTKTFDEKFDGLLILAIFALVVLLFDWGVYIYEQH